MSGGCSVGLMPRPRSWVVPCALTALACTLAVAPQAQARKSAKFKILSIGGSVTSTRDVVYEPSIYGSCTLNQTERVRFRSTKRATGFVFSSRAHGQARVAWSPKRAYSGNLAVVEVPGEATISRTATYQQTNYLNPDTGQLEPGCWQEFSPVDCADERTVTATLEVGGTSVVEGSTYFQLVVKPRDLNAIDSACPGEFVPSGDVPLLFDRADLFNRKLKRLRDSVRIETPGSTNAGGIDESRRVVQELAAELKRKKLRR